MELWSCGQPRPWDSWVLGGIRNARTYYPSRSSTVRQFHNAPSVSILHPPRPFTLERVHFWAQLARFAENFGGHLRFR